MRLVAGLLSILLVGGCATVGGPSPATLEAHERRAAQRTAAERREREARSVAARESSEPALARAVLRMGEDPRSIDRLEPGARRVLAVELGAVSDASRDALGLLTTGFVTLGLGLFSTGLGAMWRRPRPVCEPWDFSCGLFRDDDVGNVFYGVAIGLGALTAVLLSIGGVRTHDRDELGERWRRRVRDELGIAFDPQPGGARLVVGGSF